MADGTARKRDEQADEETLAWLERLRARGEASSQTSRELWNAFHDAVSRMEPSPKVGEASWAVMATVVDALATGDARDVKSLAVRLNQRQRARWRRICQQACDTCEPARALGGALEQEMLGVAADCCRGMLASVDERAHELPLERVAAELRSYPDATKDPVAGVAARLACYCGAFGYRGGQEQDARRTFMSCRDA